MAQTVKTVATPKVNADAARKKGEIAKGFALAQTCVKYATEEAMQDEKRGQRRMQFVMDIAALAPSGHAEFRKELQVQLAFLSEIEEGAVKAGAVTEAPSRHGGYSAASFRVMVSNWRTISAACEQGYKPFDENAIPKPWETVLSECREARKIMAANGTAPTIEGQRKQGAGRKASSPFEKVLAAAAKLDKKDQIKLMQAIATLQGYTLTAPAAKAKAPKGADQPAVVH